MDLPGNLFLRFGERNVAPIAHRNVLETGDKYFELLENAFLDKGIQRGIRNGVILAEYRFVQALGVQIRIIINRYEAEVFQKNFLLPGRLVQVAGEF
ncbi:hypothetical protein D3C86_1949570 [compost metagenome]